MGCVPSTIGQKYASTYLTSGSFDDRFDLGDILLREENPVEQFNRQQLLDTSRAFVNTLQYMNLENYPFLESRYAQGPILYPEFGDFILKSGYDLDTVRGIIEKVEIYISGLDQDSGKIILGPYASFLNQVENYYNGNIANTISGGFCGAFANPFNQVLKAVAAISVARDLRSTFQNFSFTDLYNQIDVIKEKLLSIVDSLVGTLLQKAQNITDNNTNQLQNFGRQSTQIVQSVQRKFADVQKFFEKFSVEAMKVQIERFVNQSVEQFEELTPEAIALLLFRFCQFAELIQSFLQRPIDTFINYTQGVSNEFQLIQNLSLGQTERAVAAGAVRLSPAGVRDARTRMAAQVQAQSRSAGSQTDPDVPEGRVFVRDGYLTPTENAALSSMSDAGVPGRFKFGPGVTQMHNGNGRGHVNDAGPGDGWRRVNPDIWARMMIISRETGIEYLINSAYRSPQYNTLLNGSARRSLHMSGQALDVSMAGLSSTQIRDFIQLASQVGFGGIAYYSSSNFTHVDTGRRRTWTTNGPYAAHVNAHVRGDYVTGGVAYNPAVSSPT